MSKKIVAGYNDLLTLRPDVASEWDSVANEELLPSQVGVGSRKRVAWVCTKQHHWKAIIGNRTGVSGSSKTGSGCPVCAGRTVQPGENDLATLYPEIASEWNHVRNGTLKPTNVRPGANKKVYWTCSSCGYVWPAKIQDRALKNYGCPVCADKTVIRGVNDLATEYPDIAKDWDYQKNKKLKPDMIRPQSNFKVSWICHVCNEAWDEYVSVRVNKSKGCPYCTGQKPIVGKTDLATCFPKIATEWDHDNNEGLIPESYLPNASKRINWMCNICGHKWPARICDRVRSNTGCPRCAGKKTIPGITDLTTTHPELAREWHPQKNKKLTPNAVSAGSGKRVWWICHVCDESWQTSIYTRSSKQTGCPFCAGQQPIRGKTDFGTLHPELLPEWDNAHNLKKPEDITEKSNYKAKWICAKGHTWEATVKSRVLSGCGCPKCSGREPIEGETDLATKRPDLAKQWDRKSNGCGPETVTVSSGKIVDWCCEFGHKWREQIQSRSAGDGLCPICSKKRKRYKGASF